MANVPDELLAALTRLHHELIAPDLDRRFERVDQRFDQVLGHLDELYTRFDRLDSEYHSLVAAVERLEETSR